MAIINVRKDEHFISSGTRVENLYWLVKGSVLQLSRTGEMRLESGSVLGIMECGGEEYLCDYIAAEDCTFYTYPYHSPEDLKNIYETQPGYAAVLLMAVMKNASQFMEQYFKRYRLAVEFCRFCVEMHRQYHALCMKNGAAEKTFKKIEIITQKKLSIQIPEWKANYYRALAQNSAAKMEDFFGNQTEVVTGMILAAGNDMELALDQADDAKEYLESSRDILLCEDGQDLFGLFLELAENTAALGREYAKIQAKLEEIRTFIEESGLYEEKLVSERMTKYENISFARMNMVDLTEQEPKEEAEEETEDCLEHILSYAGYNQEEKDAIREVIVTYRELPDLLASDDAIRRIRKKLTSVFYETYIKVMKKSLTDMELTPILKMFLNFGFMDVSLTGEENTYELYDLAEELSVCESEHVYTIHRWLLSIYHGENEPSRSEFDLDYPAWLREERKQGQIGAEEEAALKDDAWNKVLFEINHMFKANNRATYGRVSTFCPVTGGHDFVASPGELLVTAEKIKQALDHIRDVDFSLFYHDVVFSDPAHGINRENIKKEILPQIILMPNAGNRAMMWQETGGSRRDTPARFAFPVFTRTSVEELMIETAGRYRWEFCRREQGARWNDVTDKSLTAEYCDYLQFYRKNRELSAEAKEKIKNELFRAKNNYREVFVKVYVNWVCHEVSGSFRLNKIARGILFTYCPFSEKHRKELAKNPVFQSMLERRTILMERDVKRVAAVFDKYQKSGGEMTEELENNLAFYKM